VAERARLVESPAAPFLTCAKVTTVRNINIIIAQHLLIINKLEFLQF